MVHELKAARGIRPGRIFNYHPLPPPPPPPLDPPSARRIEFYLVGSATETRAIKSDQVREAYPSSQDPPDLWLVHWQACSLESRPGAGSATRHLKQKRASDADSILRIEASAYPPTTKYSTPFELSNSTNSLKSLLSIRVGRVNLLSQKLDRGKSFLDRTRQPVDAVLRRRLQRCAGDDFAHGVR